MSRFIKHDRSRVVRSVAAGLIAAVAACGLIAPAMSADSISAQVLSKAYQAETGWTGAFAERGKKVPIIVQFRMPELPDAASFATEGDADKAHMAAVRAMQEKILGGIVASGPAGLDAAQASTDVNLKLMPFSPQFAMLATAEEVEKLAANPDVETIYEDKTDRPYLTDSLPLIGMPSAYSQGATGNGYAVAILDTGARRTHEFLSSRVVSAACYSTNNSSGGATSTCPGGATSSTALTSANDCDQGSANGCGHGTHVSGTAAGFNTGPSSGEPANGVARDGRLITINVFSRVSAANCGSGATQPCMLSYVSDQIAGLNRVYALRTSYNIASINMSLGGGAYSSACDSDPRKSIIDSLRAVNIATVIAAGNDGYDFQVGAPGCISSAITVANSTKTDGLAASSNWGNLIDVVAPGSSILASYTNGTNGYAYLTGTSMASPHVAGAFAALRSKVPGASVTAIENALESTGLGITWAGITKPRIRVANALAVLLGGTPPPPPPPPANNDTFANRIAITPPTTAGGTRTVTGSNVGYTKQSGEPNHYGLTGATTSAWWRYTPASSGTVTITTQGSSFDTVLAVYRGSAVNALTEVASNDDYSGLQSRVSFAATAGTQYQIAVAGYGGASGSIQLNVTGGGGSTTPPPSTTSIVAATTPVARAAGVGVDVTAFATILNTGSATATGCSIALPSGLPVQFTYRTRSASGVLGAANTPVNIPPVSSAPQGQGFLLTFRATSALSSNIALRFDCTNTAVAPSVRGLNTFLFTATTGTPPADVISTAVTATGDGIMNVPLGGTGFAALAAQNIGSGASLQARISTTPIGGSTVTLPLTNRICRTNSAGACTTAQASTVNFSLGVNGIATFSAFSTSNGTTIPFDPANRRVFIHFYQGSTPVGSASVAVRTTGSGSSSVTETASIAK